MLQFICDKSMAWAVDESAKKFVKTVAMVIGEEITSGVILVRRIVLYNEQKPELSNPKLKCFSGQDLWNAKVFVYRC